MEMLKFNTQLLRVYYLWDKRSFKKAINVTYFVMLSSEMHTHRRMYFTGGYTCEAKLKSQWRRVRALPSHVKMLLLDQSKVCCQ